jgi:hypothetical protein
MENMNYFIANLFNDWKYWARLGVIFIAVLDVLDVLSVSFAAPGFFNLWMVKITGGAALIGLIVYMLFLYRHEKKNRQIKTLLPAFLAARREYFIKMTAADPKFQTFCFDCRHYNHERRCCSLRLHDREVRIKLQPLDVFSYCLYWNLGDHPIMALTESSDLQWNQSEADSV